MSELRKNSCEYRKKSPNHLGGHFFLLKITFPLISGDFRAKTFWPPQIQEFFKVPGVST